VGLVVAGIVFQDSKQGRKWLRGSIKLLEQECLHQILEDGGSAEQSLNYHRFVLDLFWFIVDLLELNDFHDCTKLRNRLEPAEHFLGAFSVAEDQPPQIGDSDDGHAIATGLSPRRIIPDKPRLQKDTFSVKTFRKSGYTIINDQNQLLMTFDHGPLGMAPLFNHGHADALSITLQVKGKPFLVDPGTYRYNGKQVERIYFRGTRAHNTITIDSKDQAQQLTNFIWDDTYSLTFENYKVQERCVILQASHDGYSNLPDPAFHTRTLLYQDIGLCVIKDTFKGSGRHNFELNFHLHPDIRVENDNDWIVLSNREAKVFMKLLNFQFNFIRGCRNPFIGWYSSGYGLIQETTVLQSRQIELSEKASFTTIICTKEPTPNLNIEKITSKL